MTRRPCPERCGFSVDASDPDAFDKALQHLADNHPKHLGGKTVDEIRKAKMIKDGSL